MGSPAVKPEQPEDPDDERVSIELDFEEALRGLLAVDPDDDPTEVVEEDDDSRDGGE